MRWSLTRRGSCCRAARCTLTKLIERSGGLHQALVDVSEDIERDRQLLNDRLGPQYGAIFAAHRQLLEDSHLRTELNTLVVEEHCSPEFAVRNVLRRYVQLLQEMHHSHLADRAHDLLDLEQRLLDHLLSRDRENLAKLEGPAVVLAHDLTPSQTARLDRQRVLGFATESGGEGGHTAILARGLEIPAVVGAGRFLHLVERGTAVIVDGDRGRILFDPDEATRAQYEHESDDHKSQWAALTGMPNRPAVTVDGTRIAVMANIEFPDEVAACLERGADGVGLYRTEFLYLGVEEEPTEEDHYQAYCQVIDAMGDHPVVIRTLDLGADKMGHLPPTEDEHNPFLGLRSIRLSLRNVDLFRVQLRAVLRASTRGHVELLFPLITTLKELRHAKMILRETMEDLEEAGIPFDRHLPIGMMVEVPAAVVMLDQFADDVDFISIGTNDLIQYALAVDRSNKEVADLYQACDPAVIRLIRMTLDSAASSSLPAHICGQMSATPHQAMLLLGLGLRTLSVPPSSIPVIKKLCQVVSIDECERIAGDVLQMQTAHEIDTCLREEYQRRLPTVSV